MNTARVPATLWHALMDWSRDAIARGSKVVSVMPWFADLPERITFDNLSPNSHEPSRRQRNIL